MALLVAGLVLLVLGSRWLVSGAVEIATVLGVSELVIGLTIVAAGTSLPELATSVLASVRGARDLAVGNIIGSNTFNILAVSGLSNLIAPDGTEVTRAALFFDIPVMIAAAVACLPILFSGYLIARWEGALFLGAYVAYISDLVLQATEHLMLPAFRAVMLFFVLPLTALVLTVVAVRDRNARPYRGRGSQGTRQSMIASRRYRAVLVGRAELFTEVGGMGHSVLVPGERDT